MNILVTGDRGYIGAVLVPMLLKKGHIVTGLDAEFYNESFEQPLEYRKITKDIRNVTAEDLKGFDAVIHLAALSNDPMGAINPTLTEDINLTASKKLAVLAKEVGIKRFIFSSSCSIYGIAGGTVDETSPVSPQTAYAESKIKFETYLKELADDNFTVALLRNSTVYGYSPKFRNDLVVNNFVTCALALGTIRVMSDGSPWRPLIDVRDLSSVFIEFLEKDKEKINADVINIGFAENNVQVKDILDIVKKALPECTIEYTGEHGADTRSYKESFDKFKSLFPDFEQEWTIEKSVEDLIARLRKMNFQKEDFVKGRYTRLVALKKKIEAGELNKELFRNKA